MNNALRLFMASLKSILYTRTDVTVVNSAYDTSGNGGRKLVRLSNGWLVSASYSGTTIYFHASSDNGATWSLLTSNTVSNTVLSVSIVAKGTMIYSHSLDGANVKVVRFDALSPSLLIDYIDSGQSTLGTCSITINSTGTELHACWSSKNATYPNSFNIRYAKGTISQVDGSVTWGAVTQVTTNNSTGQDVTNPSIIYYNNPIIVHQTLASGTYTIQYRKYNGTSWSFGTIYNGGSYTQSNPSVIFVPQSVNGLANGRIWVAWHGLDATDVDWYNIRTSYSDDGGATWSTVQKLTSGNVCGQVMPSITATKNNEVFVLWHGQNTSSSDKYNIKKKSYKNSSWGAISQITNNTTANATYNSTLFDLSIDFTTPLFIYANAQTSKVGFYGTWTE